MRRPRLIWGAGALAFALFALDPLGVPACFIAGGEALLIWRGLID